MTSLSPARTRLVLVSLLVVSLLGALDHTVVATSLGTIAGSLGAGDQLGLVVVPYTLSSAVAVMTLGQLGDRFGPRRVFLLSLVSFLLASLACGFAESMSQLVIARVVQGVSSAGLQLMSQTIVALVSTPRQRPKMLSIVGAAFPIAILVGPVVGGVITDQLGWRWVFWINLPFGVAALVLALAAIPAITTRGARAFDVLGTATLSLAMVALVAALTWVGQPDRGLAIVISIVVAVLSLAAFSVVERRVQQPILPLRLFASRTLSAGVALSAVLGVGLFSVVSFIPTYVQFAYGTTATISGLVPIATVFGMLVSSLTTGWLVSRSGRYRTWPVLGTGLAATGLLGMSVLPPSIGLWGPVGLMALVGVGSGAFMSLVVAVVQSAAPRSATGTVTAATNLVRQLGATMGTAVIGGVVAAGVAARLPSGIDPGTFTPELARSGSDALRELAAQAYGDTFSPVFAGLGLVYVLGFVAALQLPRNRLADESESHLQLEPFLDRDKQPSPA